MHHIIIAIASLTTLIFLLATVIYWKRASQSEKTTGEIEEELKKLKAENSELAEKLNESSETKDRIEKDLQSSNQQMKKQERTIEKLETQIEKLKEEIKADPFDGRFPICSQCKDIRDSQGYWHPIEEYIQNLSDADFSHSLCPKCAQTLYPDMFKNGSKPHTLTWK
jgi:DNA repair exonuclease SbcCD ATPase subunit